LLKLLLPGLNTSMARYKGKHYSVDSKKHQKAVEKSRQTILDKFGKEGYSRFRSDLVKEQYALEAVRLDESEIVTEEAVVDFLNNYNPTHFKGRAGNRTMKKYNLSMYKSLMHHTDKFSALFNNRPIPFSGRIDIALKGFELSEEDVCYCGKRIKFNPKTQAWDKLYCVQCRMTGTSKPHFKYKYGGEWEKMWRSRNVTGAINRGVNEVELLDRIEKEESITIDRGFRLLNFYPDGYCKSNNIIYEVYESHHKAKSYLERDQRRQQIIQDYLKCDFCIIWDDGSNEVELHKYV